MKGRGQTPLGADSIKRGSKGKTPGMSPVDVSLKEGLSLHRNLWGVRYRVEQQWGK